MNDEACSFQLILWFMTSVRHFYGFRTENLNIDFEQLPASSWELFIFRLSILLVEAEEIIAWTFKKYLIDASTVMFVDFSLDRIRNFYNLCTSHSVMLIDSPEAKYRQLISSEFFVIAGILCFQVFKKVGLAAESDILFVVHYTYFFQIYQADFESIKFAIIICSSI